MNRGLVGAGGRQCTGASLSRERAAELTTGRAQGGNRGDRTGSRRGHADAVRRPSLSHSFAHFLCRTTHYSPDHGWRGACTRTHSSSRAAYWTIAMSHLTVVRQIGHGCAVLLFGRAEVLVSAFNEGSCGYIIDNFDGGASGEIWSFCDGSSAVVREIIGDRGRRWKRSGRGDRRGADGWYEE